MSMSHLMIVDRLRQLTFLLTFPPFPPWTHYLLTVPLFPFLTSRTMRRLHGFYLLVSWSWMLESGTWNVIKVSPRERKGSSPSKDFHSLFLNKSFRLGDE